MAIDQLTSNLVKNQFPEFLTEDAPNFLLFIKAYYEYMEQSGKSVHELNKLKSYKDIDDTLDEYIEYFRRTVLPSLPLTLLADKRLLAKTIRDFYQSKGTFDSYKFLFRILYDEDIEVNYPADQMLKVSDGDWRINRYVIISSNEQAYKFIGKTIQGIESRGEAFVENVVRRFLGGRDMMEITLSKIKGNFVDLETIKLKSAIASVGFEPEIEVGINSISVESRGAQYAPGDEVDLISSITGTEGKGVITNVITQAGIINFTIADGGSGYTASTANPGTIIKQIGGDGTSDASFIISTSDITDTFAIARNINLLSSNTIFGANAAVVSFSGITDPTAAARPANMGRRSSTFANTIISSPHYGFPEASEVTGESSNFRTNANAVMKIANTVQGLTVGQPIYGVTSGANGIVLSVQSTATGAGLFRVDTYKNFTGTESIKVGSKTGNTVGTLVSGQFYANTIGYHVLQVGNVNSQTIAAGDELVGSTDNIKAFGIVKKVMISVPNGYLHQGTSNTSLSGTVSSSGNTVTGSGTSFTSNFEVGDEIKAGSQTGRRIFSIASDTSLVTTSQFNPVLSSGAYGKGGNYRTLLKLQVTANTSANLTSQWDAGPMKPFVELESVRKVGSTAGTGTLTTNNSVTTVTGNATNFAGADAQVVVGDIIIVGSQTRTITAIAGETSLTVNAIFDPTLTNSTFAIRNRSVGNVAFSTSNTEIENIHTKLIDALVFKTAAFGTIEDLSLKIGGAGYSVAPIISVNDSQISSLGIRDVFLTVQNTASNWATGVGSITTFDTNDRLEQALSGAKGDVKQIPPSSPQQFGKALSTIVHANTTIETVIRVFQDELQATSNINYRLGRTAIKFHTSADQSALAGTGVADIVKIDDNGVLGQNAVITGTVGANGAIEAIRTLDSGYAYKDGETVIFSPSTRADASSGTGVLTMKNAANSEGYYASNRSQVSTKRGYIQDSYRYQEFSYEITSGVAFNRYKDLVNNLVHPAGQKLFGQFTTRTPLDVNLVTVTDNRTRKLSVGKIVATNDSFILSGASTLLTTNFSNNDIIVIEHPHKNYRQTKLNIVTSATAANLISVWPDTTIPVAGANVYYYTGTVS